MKNTCILFATHRIDEFIVSQIERINSVSNEYDIVILLHDEFGKLNETIPQDLRKYVFTEKTVRNAGYKMIKGGKIYDNNLIPMLMFFNENQIYDYYWYVEFDVMFNGNWRTFFNAMSRFDTDFLASHIMTFDEHKEWHLWNTVKFETIKYTCDEWLKSFNVISRYSNAALQTLHRTWLEGNLGHHECTVPTILTYHKHSIGDFGGSGKFVLPGCINKYYVTLPKLDINWKPSTVRWNPPHEMIDDESGRFANTLFHPVKKQWTYISDCL